MKLRSVRGTHDIYGEDIEKYNIIENKVSKIAELNSFNKLETPIFESVSYTHLTLPTKA